MMPVFFEGCDDGKAKRCCKLRLPRRSAESASVEELKKEKEPVLKVYLA